MKVLDHVAVVIPAYNPSRELLDFVDQLSSNNIKHIIVINDGSRKECDAIFYALEKKQVFVLTHVVNMGKGRALKTAFNFCLQNLKSCQAVVTADADGQHSYDDVVNVAQHVMKNQNQHIILGARCFDGVIPARSMLGNVITRNVFRFITGKKIIDTQTGLRGIPMYYLPALLAIKGEKYEYELNMLLSSTTYRIGLTEVPIKTIYIDNNKNTHFRPLHDSAKIYLLFLRFISSSLVTTVFDYICFGIFYFFVKNLFFALICARLAASVFNFFVNGHYVFENTNSWIRLLMAYYLLFFGMSLSSFVAIQALCYSFGIGVFIAKMTTEFCLFPLNFFIQRCFVFKNNFRQKKGICDENSN